MLEAVNVERLGADIQLVAGAERIRCGDSHLRSFRALRTFYDNRT
jgi:hypothetical protein